MQSSSINSPANQQWSINAAQKLDSDPLLDCLVLLTEHFGNPCSAEALSAGLPMSHSNLSTELVPQAATRAGLSAKLVRKGLDELPSMLLPCILLLNDKKALVLQELNFEENKVIISLPETNGEEQLTIEELEASYTGYLFLVKQRYRGDKHFDVHVSESNEHWLWPKIKKASPIYRDVIIASIMVNVFALITPLFVMNVYDKVVPNLAFESLWVLSIGATIAFIFDFVLKQLRSYLIDVAGKKIDIEISSNLFSKVIGIPMEKKSPSVGGMAKQIGEFDNVREFLSSITITGLVDLPFALLFMFIIWLVAGQLVIFPFLAAVLIIGFTLLKQSKLRHAIEESNKFSSLRHGHLVESLSALEAIKVNGAEGVVQRAWQQMVGHTASWLMQSKIITNSVTNFASFISQVSIIGVVILGVYQVSESLISVGSIIAAVLLTSRAVAPIARLAGLMTRTHQTASALRQLDELMDQQGEFEDKGHLISRTNLKGNIKAEHISFKYPSTDTLTLHSMSLEIKEGEKIAIVGHNGSGKSTFAKLLLGLYQPTSGSIQFDGVNHNQIHPADLRRNVGYVPQDITLFHGTIRDNILFGTRQVTEYQLIRAVQLSGVGAFTDADTLGLDQQVGEGGNALSRGQRQSIALARAILNSPQILLLDEPTASLDARAEKQFIQSISQTAKTRTLLLITHKMELLNLVDRILVLDKGKLILDGPKEQVLAQLSSDKNRVSKGSVNKGGVNKGAQK